MSFDKGLSVILDLEDELRDKKIIIYGAKKDAKITAFILNQLNMEICYFIEEENNLLNNKLLNKDVNSLKVILKENKDDIKILVANSNYINAAYKLIDMGFEEEVHFYPVFNRLIKGKESNRENRVINGVPVGKYSYGVERLCYPGTFLKSVGAFCSFHASVVIVPGRRPLQTITTHPSLLYMKKDHSVGPERVPGLVDDEFLIDLSIIPNNEKVEIGNDVWLGANVVILPSVKIGNGAVIGAGSVVTKDVPDYAIMGGTPAKVLKYRFDEKQRDVLDKVEWWKWSDEQIREHSHLFTNSELFFKRFS